MEHQGFARRDDARVGCGVRTTRRAGQLSGSRPRVDPWRQPRELRCTRQDHHPRACRRAGGDRGGGPHAATGIAWSVRRRRSASPGGVLLRPRRARLPPLLHRSLVRYLGLHWYTRSGPRPLHGRRPHRRRLPRHGDTQSVGGAWSHRKGCGSSPHTADGSGHPVWKQPVVGCDHGDMGGLAHSGSAVRGRP